MAGYVKVAITISKVVEKYTTFQKREQSPMTIKEKLYVTFVENRLCGWEVMLKKVMI